MAANDPRDVAPAGDGGEGYPSRGPGKVSIRLSTTDLTRIAASRTSGREHERNFEGTQRTFGGKPWDSEGMSYNRSLSFSILRRTNTADWRFNGQDVGGLRVQACTGAGQTIQNPGTLAGCSSWITVELVRNPFLHTSMGIGVYLTYADPSKAGMRKVAASEHYDLSSLQRLYGDYPSTKVALRLFHIQNASWATYWVLKKFAIQDTAFESRTKFTQWVKQRAPKRRAGKALMNAHTWNTKHDPYRGTSTTAFGLDYLKKYAKHTSVAGENVAETEDQAWKDGQLPMMELNSYDTEGIFWR